MGIDQAVDSKAFLLYQAFAGGVSPRRRLTVSQWADAHRILSSKESAEPGRWRTRRNPPLQEPMDCFSSRSAVKEVVMQFPIQIGKALALNTPIPTPSGWKMMGDLEIGDYVFDENGAPVRISYVSEIFNDHPCYEGVFSDGTKIIADGGHRWKVDCDRHYHRPETIILTTEEMAKNYKHKNHNIYAIPVAKPLRLPIKKLKIPPYILGLWLGDGSYCGNTLHLFSEDTDFFIQKIISAGYRVKCRTNKSRCIDVLVNPLGIINNICRRGHDVSNTGIYQRSNDRRSEIICAECARQDARFHKHGKRRDPVKYPSFTAVLKEYGIFGNKRIPLDYLRASYRQRLQLMQGLMDSDGYINKIGRRCEICSSKKDLAMDIVELARSLGLKPTIKIKKTSARDSYRIGFMAYRDQPIFSLPRKKELLASKKGRRVSESQRRRIVNITRVASVPTRCIAVESESHLFLAGSGMIPTHNTSVAQNILGYAMTENPGPIMVALPAEVSMNKWIVQKLQPLLEETGVVRQVLTSTASRDKSNRREFKDFIGGQLYLEHAGSPARLKSTSVKLLIVDELDEFADNLQGGDDPVALLEGRTSAFSAVSRRLYISTPTIKGRSRIEELYEDSDRRRYYVPCPECGHEQPLEWRGLQWIADEHKQIKSVSYVCRECGVLIDEHHKTKMLENGRWVAENPGHPRRGYTLNGLYYPLGLGPRWQELAQMWLQAQNDPARLKTFVNDRLAETWEDRTTAAIRTLALQELAEPYPLRHAPDGVLAVTAGVDTQDNRLECAIIGYGEKMRMWVLDYVVLPGDPAEPHVWVALTDLLNRPIEHESGASLRVLATAIDLGGHRTEAVKDYVRGQRIARPMAIHGAKANTAPVLGKPKMVDVDWRGRYDKKGVRIYQVGTVAVKHWLYSRLAKNAELPKEDRLIHFSDGLPPEFFQGLVSETYNPIKNRFELKRNVRNEPLDCTTYAIAAAHHPELRLHLNSKQEWQRYRKMLTAQQSAEEKQDSQPSAADLKPIDLTGDPWLNG